MQNKLLTTICILFFAGLSLYYFLDRGESADLNLIELKTFENSEVATSSKENVALYKKEFVDGKGETREMYLTLGEMRDDDAVLRERLQKVHTNIFWDPNRCAQMLNIIGYKDIVFSDTFKEAEGDGFTTFVYKYDMQQNTLTGYKVGVSLQKIFTNGADFYGISKQKNIWTLYKINFITKRLEEIETYKHNLQLITASDDLKWCDSSNQNCVTENNFHFASKDKRLKEEIDSENPLNLKVFYEGTRIFELSKEDRIGYYILGIRPKQE